MDLRKVEAKIGKMLQAIIEDLLNGLEQGRAGYRTSDAFDILPSQERELLRSGILDKNSKGKVRFDFKNRSLRQKLKRFDLQLNQIDCFLEDTKKIEKAKKFLDRITIILQKYPEAWQFIIALGWWKMMEVSEMPARVDDILGEGFSPKDWMTKAPKSSFQIALNIARRYGKIDDLNEAVKFLRKEGINIEIEKSILALALNHDDVQRVMKILKWDEIKAKLTNSIIKMLAFHWALFFILKYNDSLPLSTEFSLKLCKMVWNSVENLLKEKRSDLLSDLENAIKILSEKEIIWASDIIRLPEVI